MSDESQEHEHPPVYVKVEDASVDDLLKKPRRTRSFTVTLPTDDGGVRQAKITFQAIPPKEYDDLVAAHPPVGKAKGEGALWNADTFPAALISAVSLRPKMSYAEAKDVMDSPDWSGGETGDLFGNALQVCNRGLDVPFNETV